MMDGSRLFAFIDEIRLFLYIGGSRSLATAYVQFSIDSSRKSQPMIVISEDMALSSLYFIYFLLFCEVMSVWQLLLLIAGVL
jgi:hypothetical protein